MGKVIQCHCSHSYQDELYGKSKRYFNTMGSGQKVTGYRCSVCNSQVGASSEDKKIENKQQSNNSKKESK